MYVSPFADLTLQQIYDGLMSGKFGPRWPDEKLQKGYVGSSGPQLLKRALDFIAILDRDGAFKEGWKGLDYGCGWGRFLSTMLSKGKSGQLDGCDAWQITLGHINKLGFANYIFKVSELLKEGEISPAHYDFVMSFSVFTHLSPSAFEHNLSYLMSTLKPSGVLYITVRHAEFIQHKYADRADELNEALRDRGIAFVDSGGDLTGQKLFGDTIVTKEYMMQHPNVRYLGLPHTLQHVYAIAR